MIVRKLIDDLRKQPPETWLLLIFFAMIFAFRACWEAAQ